MNNKGFTLLEALVAITLIMITMGGPFLAAERAYVQAEDAKNYLTASFLAQEALEYVRMLRETVYLEDADDTSFPGVYCDEGDLTCIAYLEDFLGGESNSSYSIYGCADSQAYSPTHNPGGEDWGGYGNQACALDTSLGVGIGGSSALQTCSSSNLECTNKPLRLNTSTNQYTFSGNGKTEFNRAIRIFQLGDTSVEIRVTVTWSFHGQPRKIELSNYLTQWQ